MKKNLAKRLLTSVAALALGVTTLAGAGVVSASEDAGSGVFRTLDEIKESGTINIGVFSDKYPFGYVDENGDYQDMTFILQRESARISELRSITFLQRLPIE